MEIFENKRKLKRRHLIYYLRVFDATTEQLVGHLVDVTAEGMMLISDHAIDIGKQYHLHMNLPAEILGREAIQFDAQVIWCHKDVNPDFFAFGLRIFGIIDEDVEVIDHLITRYGFKD